MLAPVTLTEFTQARMKDSYLDGRWCYYQCAIELLIRNYLLAYSDSTCLEIGPRTFTLIHGATYMDRHDYGLANTTVHDADVHPWPFADTHFGVVLALQVIEHMQDKPGFVQESLRVASHLILSFPYKWTAGPQDHRGLTLCDLESWTEGYRILETRLPDLSRCVVHVARLG